MGKVGYVAGRLWCDAIAVAVDGVRVSSSVGRNKGQRAECSAAGLGIISSLVAASVQQSCLDRYQKQGYHQIAAAPPSAAAGATPTAAPSAAPKTSANGKGQKGQPTQCNVFGMGLVGSLVALSMQQTCIAQQQQQALHQAPATTPAAQLRPINRRQGRSHAERSRSRDRHFGVEWGVVNVEGRFCSCIAIVTVRLRHPDFVPAK